MMGHAYGTVAGRFFPGLTIEVTAYALVGMGGVLAAATHAPISAIIIIFEMTGDYGLILPLMLTCVVSYLLARRMYPESVYTEALQRAGERIAHGVDRSILERVLVRECYNPRLRSVNEGTAIKELLDKVTEGRQVDIPVVDDSGGLQGVIAYQDLLRVAREAHLHDVLLAIDIAIPDVEPVTRDDPVITAMRRMNDRALEVLPVVESQTDQKLIGVISRTRIWQAYDAELLRIP